MYEIEITFNQGTERELTWEETYPTLDLAVKAIERHAQGQMICRAWINNKEVQVRNSAVMGADGERFCTNEKFHEIFAPHGYPRILPCRDIEQEHQFKKMKMLMSNQLRVPTNPATNLTKE